jgi:hypothetical protein
VFAQFELDRLQWPQGTLALTLSFAIKNDFRIFEFKLGGRRNVSWQTSEG